MRLKAEHTAEGAHDTFDSGGPESEAESVADAAAQESMERPRITRTGKQSSLKTEDFVEGVHVSEGLNGQVYGLGSRSLGYKHSIWGWPPKLEAKVQFFCSGQHFEVYLSIRKD